MKEITRREKIFGSLIAIVSAFFGFWGISILAALAGGIPIEKALPDKLFFFGAVYIFQICLAISLPLRNRFHLWLRVAVVAVAVIFSSEYFMTKLLAFKLISADFIQWWGRLTILFAFILGLRIFLNLRRCVPRFDSTVMKSSAKPDEGSTR